MAPLQVSPPQHRAVPDLPALSWMILARNLNVNLLALISALARDKRKAWQTLRV